MFMWGARVWRDSSVVKRSGCSFRGPGYCFQHPQCDHRCLLALDLGDLTFVFWPKWLSGTYTTYDINTNIALCVCVCVCVCV